jgi:hypothetical protein
VKVRALLTGVLVIACTRSASAMENVKFASGDVQPAGSFYAAPNLARRVSYSLALSTIR